MVAVRATSSAGRNFLDLARDALHIANMANCPVEFAFNDIRLVATKHGRLEDIDRQMDTHHPKWKSLTASRRTPAQPA